MTVRHKSHGRNKKVERDDKKGQKLVDRLENMKMKKKKKEKKVPLKYSVKPDVALGAIVSPQFQKFRILTCL